MAPLKETVLKATGRRNRARVKAQINVVLSRGCIPHQLRDLG